MQALRLWEGIACAALPGDRDKPCMHCKGRQAGSNCMMNSKRQSVHSHCRDEAATIVFFVRSARIKLNMRCVSRKAPSDV